MNITLEIKKCKTMLVGVCLCLRHMSTSPARKVKISTVLDRSAIYSLLLWEIKLHKQTSHAKDDIKQNRQAEKNTVSCIHTNSDAVFSKILHTGRILPKVQLLVTQ